LDFLSKEGEAPRIVKAGIPAEAMAILTDDEKLIFRKGTERLAAYGIDVSEVSLPEFELFPVVHGVVGSVEASSSAGKYDGVRYGHRAQGAKNWNDMYLKSRGEAFGTLVKSYLFQGAYFQFENYEIFEKAGRIRARLVKGLNDLLDRVDALILPTKRMSFEARRAETVADVYRAFTLTLPANVAGLPALQLPGFLMNGTGDLGMQLIGPAFGDAGLLGLANLISQQKGTN
jgi:aspartyl-tRNA(Asn)/glutamyl-tRNA(Gln) amidotransferase subunit A